ncbi:MAG: dipeptidase [Planctomycetes bacterium]|nr:dipeptidase [Planctomycetota bacterium]
MLPTAVVRYLESHRKKHLAPLMEFIRFASVASAPDRADDCERAARWLVKYLRARGMKARVADVPGGRPNVLAELIVDRKKPTLLMYGHYDVQPAEPLNLWKTSPFEPVIKGGRIFARGASDDKGPIFAHLMAIEAWQKAGGGLPLNIKMFIEGEEEIGSPRVEPFVAKYADELAADAVLVSDSEFFSHGRPALTYAYRGLVCLELTVEGANQDCHSGRNGGVVANPIIALARLIAKMHDNSGRITLPGFYDDVAPLGDAERRAWKKLPFDEKALARSLGLKVLAGGEKGLPALERRWARPTLDCTGIRGGHIAEGPKTIIPARATVKLSSRIVANQNPNKIIAGYRKFVAKNLPAGFKFHIEQQTAGWPLLVPLDTPALAAAKDALVEAFGVKPVFIRNGASVPVTAYFQRILGINPVLMGLGLPDDGLHGPNEKFDLNQLYRGSVAAAAFINNFSKQQTKKKS